MIIEEASYAFKVTIDAMHAKTKNPSTCRVKRNTRWIQAELQTEINIIYKKHGLGGLTTTLCSRYSLVQ